MHPAMSSGLLAGARPAATFITVLSSTTNDLTSYNLGNVNVPANGLLVLMMHRQATGAFPTVSSITVDGNSAGLYGDNTSSSFGRIIGAYRVAAGNRAIVVNLSGVAGANLRLVVGCYVITGDLVSDVPIGVDDVAGASASTRVLTFDRGHGVGIFSALMVSTTTFSYTSATQDNTGTISNGGTGQYSFASLVTTPGTAVVETVTFSSSMSGSFQGAAWR